MDLGLLKKVALVTGASAGIGFGVARALAQAGARVIIASRNQERIEKAAGVLRQEGYEALGVVQDVTHPDAGECLREKASEAYGGVDVLVTNAGGPPGGNFSTLVPRDFEPAVELSFLSVVRLTHALLPHMLKQKWGRILHISSATVIEPNPDLFLSSAIRPAVVGFSKSLANEVASQGVTVNLVCPGFIATERLWSLAERRALNAGITPKEAMEAMADSIPMGRIGSVEEIADAMVFLCSARASYITGVALRVDGGKVAFSL